MSGQDPTSRGFISQRLRLNYVDWGNPQAPLLLLIHGSRDHARAWDWTAQALRRDWRVVAPDLRGHGDSAWSPEGRYDFAGLVYDLAQLAFHLDGGPATIIGHSLGAHIALRYAGLFPDAVTRLVAVEPVGAPPALEAERNAPSLDVRMRRWIEEKREAADRQPRRYASIDDALARMRAENVHLSREQAHHLTIHGVRRNEDDSFSWKFDPLLRVWPFPDHSKEEVAALWRRIRCPTLLMYGRNSWPSSLRDDLARNLAGASTVEFEDAGHWLHHDRFGSFIAELSAFLAAPEGEPRSSVAGQARAAR